MNKNDFNINVQQQLITNSLIEAISNNYEMVREKNLKKELEREINDAKDIKGLKKGIFKILVNRNLLLKNKEHYFLEGKLSKLLQKCGVKENKFISMKPVDKKSSLVSDVKSINLEIVPLVTEQIYELSVEKLMWLAESLEDGVSDSVYIRWIFEPEINVREYIFSLVKAQLKNIKNEKESMRKKQKIEEMIKEDLLNIIDKTLSGF
ncbi:hypothetical protein [Bacillus cereus]|uniref:hypothetical protein n=1 Tax=Bacillus cereus TaxID=1396 RepID=UPI000B4A9F0A|nr:hypothetical protein [Bacillus cereus]